MWAAPSVFSEGAWLSGIPKNDRAKLSKSFAALKTIGDRIRDAHASAVRHEAQYARKARALSFDPAASAESLQRVTDQRQLRWESARELAEGRYGRAGKSGFESLSVLEKQLEAEAASFSAVLGKHLPKLSNSALASLAADLEQRVSSHPDCPQAAFSVLRAEASVLSPAEKRRWVLSIASGLPRTAAASFPERLTESGDDRFSAALKSFHQTIEAALSVKVILPAAAAASWYVDSFFSPLPAPSAASFVSPIAMLAEADVQTVAAVLSEFPDLDIAFSEWSALIWVLHQRKPSLFQSEFGIEPELAKNALKKAWAIKAPASSMPPREASLTPQAVRAAERMAVFCEGPATDAEVLGAYALLRTDQDALFAFDSGARYSSARDRVSSLFGAALSAAEKGALPASPSFARVGGASFTAPFVVIAYKSSEGVPLRLERSVPPLAFSLAKAMGFNGNAKKKEDAVPWLESRGVFFSLPCVAGGTPPGADEWDLLSENGAFYPLPAALRTGARFRYEVLRKRFSLDASRLGVPLRFVDSPLAPGRYYAAFASCAALYAHRARTRNPK